MIRELNFLKISYTSSIRDAMALINRFPEYKTALVFEDDKFLGIVSEGDLRRALLNDFNMVARVSSITNKKPIYLTNEDIIEKKYKHGTVYPTIIDKELKFFYSGIKSKDKPFGLESKPTVLIMAGGFGTRLRPLTNDCPKPMLKINGKPILEIILNRLISQGFHDFIISTHYLPNVIINHFQDGHEFGCNIAYIHEHDALGTGGSLSLVDCDADLIMINGDIITDLDFFALYELHVKYGRDLTIATRKYLHQVAFGVVRQTDEHLVIEEKPIIELEVNAGIYCISKNILEIAKCRRGSYDFPEFINSLRNSELKIGQYQFGGQWIDIGRPGDFDFAKTKLVR